jgi:hypothetical protein
MVLFIFERFSFHECQSVLGFVSNRQTILLLRGLDDQQSTRQQSPLWMEIDDQADRRSLREDRLSWVVASAGRFW